jgi:hypothetical protein
MRKNIIIELEKIKSLMNLITEQGSADITDMRRSETQLDNAPKESFGIMDQYKIIKIGQGTDYPIILEDESFTIMGDPLPHLKQSDGSVTASKFVPNVRIDENGEEYTIINNKKYCLPTKKSGFWDLLSSGKYVYRFTNPKNDKGFSMVLITKKNVTAPVSVNSDGTPNYGSMTGSEASVKCLGGDNGWEFKITGGVLFWDKDGNPYDPNNPEHFDVRSTFDEWWDKYGLAIEIVAGVAASFTGAWLAGLLIRSGLIVGSLAGAYGAGSETILSVVLQAAIESGLMLPISKYQWERGNESDAILSISFALLPFLTELGSVQKYIRGGISPGTSKSLSDKLMSMGGSSKIYSTDKTYETFLESLNGNELGLWKATVEQFSTREGAKQYEGVLQRYLKNNESKINKTLLDNKAWVDQLDDLTAGQFSKKVLNQNVVTGKGVLAQLLRVGIPIGGVAIGFSTIYNQLKSMNYTDEQIEKVVTVFNDEQIKNNKYFAGLVKINKELTQELLNKVFLEYLSKKENIDNILNGSKTIETLKNDLLNSAIKMIESDLKYKELTDIVFPPEVINELFKSELIYYLGTLGHKNINFNKEDPLKSYIISSSLIPNGEIKFKITPNFKTNADVMEYDFKNGIEIMDLPSTNKDGNITKPPGGYYPGTTLKPYGKL